MTADPKDSGLYIVLLDLVRPVGVTLHHHRVVLPVGRYAYVGSARPHLRSRVTRHLLRVLPIKTPRRNGAGLKGDVSKRSYSWHIDWLTKHRFARRVGAVLLPGTDMEECELSWRVKELVCGDALALGFGATDCRKRTSGPRKCPAHLWRCGIDVDCEGLRASLQDERAVVMDRPVRRATVAR